MFLTKAQKRCAKRGHGYVALVHTGEVVSGCVYCGAYSGTPLGLAAMSRNAHPLDYVTHVSIALCALAIAAVAVVCALWLGAAL